MGFLDTIMGASPLPVDRTVAILDQHASEDFRVYPMAEKPAVRADVQRMAKRLGIRLPRELAAHWCGPFPGVYVEVKEAIWPRPKPYDTGPFWSFLYALHTFTASPDCEDWMRLDDAAVRFQSDTGLLAVPILKLVGDPNLFCLDADGQLVHYDHELNVLEPVGMGFFELLEREVAALRKRAERIKRGEHQPA